ncbi:MAG TPA: tetratricopeptide repeat protein [Phycisphaerales bacterium]|nr:tetratricopeptide repeat protein [Phycisphaerales bacterium]
MTMRNALIVALAGTALGLAGGCTGHGQYTAEHLSAAQAKMSQLKSGTNWQMAHQQYLAGDLDKALKNVDQSIALNPEVARSHTLRGRILLEKGELEAARAALVEAGRLDPRSPEPPYYLGIIHERYAQHEEARACYARAMELDPTSAQPLIAAADMLVESGKIDEAEALLRAHTGRFQYNAAVRQTLGNIATMRGEHAEACELFTQARLLAPDDDTVTEDLARAQIAAGRLADAEQNIAGLMERSKAPRRDLEHLRARCLAHLDRPVQAREIYLRLTTDDHGASDVAAWIGLGNAAATISDDARLRAAATRLVSIAPDRYEGFFLRALWRHRQGDLAEALSAAETAVSLAGDKDPGPMVLRGLILQDLGRLEEAQQSFRSAAEMDPGSALTRLGIAVAGVSTDGQ